MALCRLVVAFFVAVGALVANAAENDPLTLHTRQRVAATNGSGNYEQTFKTVTWDPHQTAIVICDMWNQHWCAGATRRVAELAPRMNDVVREARKRGVLIIHCPSDTMGHYADTPQRKLAQSAPPVDTKIPLTRWQKLDPAREGPLPIDDSDGGCDCQPHCAQPKGGNWPWKQQIKSIEVQAGDAFTDSVEAYYLMRQRGIENVLVMGVHTNMCVLGRPFSIRQMVSQGQNVILVRDLTDTMYNPEMRPQVPHAQGTDLVIEHIEKYWCPTVTSSDLVAGPPLRFQDDKRPHIVMLISEDEYKTAQTLPQFAREELEPRGLAVTVVVAEEKEPHRFPAIQAVKTADLLLVSVRRRALPTEQLELIRAHVAAGKPVVGIRTASHAFALNNAKPPAGQAVWPEWDRDILGGNYHLHYGNKLLPQIAVVQSQQEHPILRGVTGFTATGSLYKNFPLPAESTLLLTGTIEGMEQPEPVAWTHLAEKQNRVFYTELGAPGDFALPQFRTLLVNGIYWALNKPVAELNQAAAATKASDKPNPPADKPAKPPTKTTSAVQPSNPLSPAAALAALKTPADLRLDSVLAEPVVRKPVHLSFDERGRLWVVQYLQYPEPAGLKVLGHDSFWRATYDQVPLPPPKGVRGADKITIHEDTNGDVVYDKHTTFVEGLNIATAVCRGRGGVWILNPPYLLFYPDANQDDVPDGDPVVHLQGFGLEDTHSVVNSLRFGPDGWLYAAQGSTVTGHVSRPGDKDEVASLGQLIWRYHPTTHRYEIFAEGGGNAFGVAFNRDGELFSGHNGGDTRGFHYVQGGFSQKGFNKHGPLSNPYAFGYFPAMTNDKTPRFTHTLAIADGVLLPAKYRGQLFGISPILHYVVTSEFSAEGSTYRTHDTGLAVTSTDPWFTPVDIKQGPDGALYIADWYDGQCAHFRNYEGQIHKDYGRVYRLTATNAQPSRPRDLSKLTNAELVNLLTDSNPWTRNTALRLLGDRCDPEVAKSLAALWSERPHDFQLPHLWALHQSAGLTDDVAIQLVKQHPTAAVRAWTVRLVCDAPAVSSPVVAALVELAQRETAPHVRSQLACSARRLPVKDSLAIVRQMLPYAADAGDPHIPLLIWWAVETHVRQHPADVLNFLAERTVWDYPLVRQHLLERVMRRFAATGKREDLDVCAKLFSLARSDAELKPLLAGFEAAYAGRPLTNLPEELAQALVKFGKHSTVLGLRAGDPAAIKDALAVLANPQADRGKQAQYVQILGEIPRTVALLPLLCLATESNDANLQAVSLAALQAYDDPQIADKVLATYAQMTDDVKGAAQSLLASRALYARRWLDAALAKRVDAGAVSAEIRERLLRLRDPAIEANVVALWGKVERKTSAEYLAEVDRLTAVVNAGTGSPKAGRDLFQSNCGKCHQLFGAGGNVGPDLTAYRRADVSNLLLNIVHPSAEIREGFALFVAVTKSGRVATGLLVQQDPQRVVLRGADGQDVSLPRDDLDELVMSKTSLMPEGLLKEYSPQQVRDLLAYLRMTQPLIDK